MSLKTRSVWCLQFELMTTLCMQMINVEVGVRYFGLTAGAIASGFTEFGGGSNLSG